MISLPNPLDARTVADAIEILYEHLTLPLFESLTRPVDPAVLEILKSPGKRRLATGYSRDDLPNLLINRLRLLAHAEQQIEMHQTDLGALLRKTQESHAPVSILYSSNGHQPYTEQILLRAALYDMLKDAKKIGSAALARLHVGLYSGFPADAAHIPENAKEHSDFITFRVDYKGKELAIDDAYFTQPNGYMFFAGLAARALRSPIDVRREDSRNVITFYHPIYRKTE